LIIPFAISTAIALVLGWLFGRFFEGLPFKALGASIRGTWLQNLAVGCLVGATAFVSAVIVAVMSGGLSLAPNRESAGTSIAATLGIALLIFGFSAASEEALFRGYLLQTFVRSGLVPVGVVLTSLPFALAHLSNPDVNWLAIFNTLIAGVWFAAAYLKTRDLWFPFGIHLAWNWLQGPVFGISVSGLSNIGPDPLLRAHDSGPAWLTGGAYGIEGGVACTFALVVSLALIHFLPIKPNHIET
jgi:membrane protease YdiL (CAAX protease family)